MRWVYLLGALLGVIGALNSGFGADLSLIAGIGLACFAVYICGVLLWRLLEAAWDRVLGLFG